MNSDADGDSGWADGRIARWTTVLLVVGTVAVVAAAPVLGVMTAGGPTASAPQSDAPTDDGTVAAVSANATAEVNATNDTAPRVGFRSAPADPEPETVTQPNGTTFEARQWGDARRHGWETTDGYTIVQSNESGWWYYAREADGALEATDRRVGLDSPGDLDRHVRPTAEVPQSAPSISPDSTGQRAFEQSPGATSGRTDVPIPLLFANFADTEPDYSAASFADLYFGSDPDEATGPGSFREYFLEASDGRVNFTAGPGVVGWFDTDTTHDEAGADYGAARDYAAEAIRTADDSTDFSKYDHDGDGHVSVAIVHPGPGEEVSGDSTDIWSHRWGFRTPIDTDDGVAVTGYSLQPETVPSGEQNTIGVMAHETGHLIFDWPDLYPRDGYPGIDDWGLMGGGSYGGLARGGDSPVHPTVWTKRARGWTETPRIAPSDQPGILPPSSSVNDFYRLGDDSATSGHHFLLSFRADEGFDQGLFGYGSSKEPGLLAWRTDNSGVSNGGDLDQTLYPGTGGTFEGASCADCQSDVSLTNVTRVHDSVVFNDPPRRSLDAGESAVYAVPVDTTLPDGRTVSATWRLSSRASWADNDSDLDVALTSPDGSRTLTASETETSYEAARTAGTPTSGGWKLVESAGDDGVDYYSATTYPTLPLPTALAVDERELDAGAAADPDPVTANVTVRTGNQPYDTGAFDALNASAFTVAVGSDTVPDEDISVARRGPGAYTLTITPPARASGGSYRLAVNATDAKVGVSHTTNTSTATVTYERGGNAAPTAAVSANRTNVTVGDPVAFDARNSTDSDGSLTEYAWAFGDGTTANGSQATHAFESAGTYSAEVTVTDDDGATDTATVTVEVAEPNDAPAPAASANRTSVTVGEAVAFDAGNSTDSDGSIAAYDWTFGDGAGGAAERVVHSYSSAGTYTVELTVTDDDGATDNATVTVEVTEPNEAPTASASANRTAVTVGEAVSFDANESTDTDGRIERSQWAFDDGTTATVSQPTHAFASPGTYAVELTVTDDDGATDNATVTVEVAAPNTAPTAVATANASTVAVGDAVAFNASRSTDADGRIESYAWNLRDGSTVSGPRTTEAFSSAGTYTVELTVTDDDGATNTSTVAVEVVEANEAPTAVAAANRTAVSVGDAVAFNASESTDADGSIERYEWDFDDGTTANGSQVVHAFSSKGTYAVTLTVTDNRSGTDTTTRSVEVTATDDDGSSGGGDDDGSSGGGDDDGSSGGGDDDGSSGGGDDDGSSGGGDDDGSSGGGDDDGSSGGGDDDGSSGGGDDDGSSG
ncbi:PKD domain-containing protein, partial [Haloarcula sp. S1CR25-12]